jgi:hypothetical protein
MTVLNSSNVSEILWNDLLYLSVNEASLQKSAQLGNRPTDMRVVVNETEEGLAFDGAPCTNPARAGGLGAPLVLWRRRDESAGRGQAHSPDRMAHVEAYYAACK